VTDERLLHVNLNDASAENVPFPGAQGANCRDPQFSWRYASTPSPNGHLFIVSLTRGEILEVSRQRD
jgi:hypothetical protein